MRIGQFLSVLPPTSVTGSALSVERTVKESSASFNDALSTAMADVNSLQNEAGKAIDKMVTGEASDLHEVMVAVEKARTSFDLLMEIRNKTLEAYREIMRTQV
jgi:flagellar hook-basal body complex protein FliE